MDVGKHVQRQRICERFTQKLVEIIRSRTNQYYQTNVKMSHRTTM